MLMVTRPISDYGHAMDECLGDSGVTAAGNASAP